MLYNPIVPTPRYVEALALLLRCSPLTDLATAGREEPPFRWTPEALSLVALPQGARLGRRSLGGAGPRADAALERASRALEQAGSEALSVASAFLEQRRAHAALSP
jgi:hypothetical protein